MQRSIKFFTFVLLAFCTFSLSAQSMASADSKNALEFISLDENNNADWSFYSDESNNIYYVDFEKLNFNLSEIVVKNNDGEIVIREDVLDLPVNTIFELDFSELPKGDYQIELRSFKGGLTKSVTCK